MCIQLCKFNKAELYKISFNVNVHYIFNDCHPIGHLCKSLKKWYHSLKEIFGLRLMSAGQNMTESSDNFVKNEVFFFNYSVIYVSCRSTYSFNIFVAPFFMFNLFLYLKNNVLKIIDFEFKNKICTISYTVKYVP